MQFCTYWEMLKFQQCVLPHPVKLLISHYGKFLASMGFSDMQIPGCILVNTQTGNLHDFPYSCTMGFYNPIIKFNMKHKYCVHC